MNRADNTYIELINKIHLEGYDDSGENVRTVYADGKPAYTKSIFGVQVDFGEDIPLLTQKKVAVKSAIKELMLFWVKQSVKEEDFKEDNVSIWDEWFLEDGTLGRSYAYQFESRPHKEVVKVPKITKEKHGKLEPYIQVSKTLKEPNHNNDSKYVGKVFSTPDFGKYKVLDVKDSPEGCSNRRAVIQFLDTKWIREVDISSIIYEKNIVDNFRRQHFGVGYLGNYKSVKNYSEEDIKMLYKKWYYMLKRCYDKNSPESRNYYHKGVFVDERWHSFENYLRDVRWIPQYFLAKEQGFKGWSVDKDYYSSNCYSKDTTVWIKDGENLSYRNSNNPFYLVRPDGNKELYLSFRDAERDYNLSNLNKVYKGERKHVRGFTIEKVEIPEGYSYRYELSKNQVVELINNIKNNPSSRRLMTSFWNDADVNKKALQECAWATNWNVRGNKLDLILIQRSGDIGLGIPFNWIQYWVLQRMIASVTGLEPGEFKHQIGNLHYYDRHEDTLLKQIRLPKYGTPTIKVNEDVKDFFDFTEDDIIIERYEHGPFLRMEVAI